MRNSCIYRGSIVSYPSHCHVLPENNVQGEYFSFLLECFFLLPLVPEALNERNMGQVCFLVCVVGSTPSPPGFMYAHRVILFISQALVHLLWLVGLYLGAQRTVHAGVRDYVQCRYIIMFVNVFYRVSSSNPNENLACSRSSVVCSASALREASEYFA